MITESLRNLAHMQPASRKVHRFAWSQVRKCSKLEFSNTLDCEHKKHLPPRFDSARNVANLEYGQSPSQTGFLTWHLAEVFAGEALLLDLCSNTCLSTEKMLCQIPALRTTVGGLPARLDIPPAGLRRIKLWQHWHFRHQGRLLEGYAYSGIPVHERVLKLR